MDLKFTTNTFQFVLAHARIVNTIFHRDVMKSQNKLQFFTIFLLDIGF